MLALRPSPVHSRRGLALGISLALAVPTGMTSSPSTAQAAVVAPAEDPAVTEARALYDEGKARFDTFDYKGAVDLWTKAYAKLPDDASGVRNAMVYNIATAQEKAYEVDKDLQHLRQAVLLLEQYVKNYKAIYKRTPETKVEVDKAEARIASLKERIAKAEGGNDPTPPPNAAQPQFGGSGVDGISWTTGHTPPPDPELQEKNRKLAAESKKTDRMLIASYVCLGVGGLFLLSGGGALFGGTRANNSNVDAGRGAIGAGYGSLAVGVAGLGAGITLLVIGLGRQKRAEQDLLVSGSPVIGPGFAGASLNMRF